MQARTGRALIFSLGVLLLLIFFVEGLGFIKANSQTSDEAVHLTAGYSYITKSDFRLNPEHPPLIKEISALPVYFLYRIPFDPDPRLWEHSEEWRIGRNFLYQSPFPPEALLGLGRIPNLALGVLLLGLVGWWAYRLWGEWAALLAMGMGAFEPNLIANASLVTTDLGAALFTFLALYLLWEYVESPSFGLLTGVGLATGLALVSKYSTVVLGGILGVVAACHLLGGGALPLPGRGFRGRLGKGALGKSLEAAASLLLIASLAALVIPPSYLFQGFSTWWIGLKRVLVHQETGHQAFFLGEYSAEGWWSYFPVAFLIKTPVGSLLLILASLVFYRLGKPLARREATFLLLPVALLLAAAVQGRINIGLRHVLPVYPFLFVVASRLATIRFHRTGSAVLVLGIPLALTAGSSLRVAPHQLAYFNELVGGPGEGYRYLSDSNIDWGQDLGGVRAFVEREKLPMIYFSYFGNAPPSAYGFKYQYLPAFGHLERPPIDVLPEGMKREVLAISVCSLQGVHFDEKDLYRWLYRLRPVEKIGYSIYVYDLTGDAEAHLRLAELYLKAGPRGLALPELKKVLAIDPANSEAARLLSSLSASR